MRRSHAAERGTFKFRAAIGGHRASRGLRPIAVDAAVCAWRRAVGDADAVLDCSGDRAELVVFGDSGRHLDVFAPRLIDERLAAQTRSAFVDARRDGLADVRRFAILARRYVTKFWRTSRDDGYRVAPVHVGDVAAPPWALAYGLASWSLAPTTGGIVIRTNLYRKRANRTSVRPFHRAGYVKAVALAIVVIARSPSAAGRSKRCAFDGSNAPSSCWTTR